jgi:tRNA-dihydrouridine synthase B
MVYFKLKDVSILKKGFLAPMQEYSHLPFRLLCQEYGSGLTFSEMVNIHYILKNKENLIDLELLKSTKTEHSAVQLFGDFSLKETLKAISLMDNYKYFKVIDLNLGCPSNKIISNNSGAYNLKQIDKILPIIKDATSICKKPITVKTRLGFSKNNILKNSSLLEKTNVSAITIHGRLAEENYSKKSDVLSVRKVLSQLSIPVIYNGDVFEDNFKEYLDFPAIMVARGALGNPFIFKKINQSKYFSLTNKNRKKAILLYLKLLKKHPVSFLKTKVSLIPFFKGDQGSFKIREEISKAKTFKEITEIIDTQIKQWQ